MRRTSRAFSYPLALVQGIAHRADGIAHLPALILLSPANRMVVEVMDDVQISSADCPKIVL
jgi:hypothetical protein